MQINKKKLYDFLGISIFVFGVAVSLAISNALPMVIVGFPLVLLNRVYIFPLIITVECIKGATTEDDGLNVAEILSVISIFPVFLYDILKSHTKRVPFKLTAFYLTFPILVTLGFYVWLLHPAVFNWSHRTMSETYVRIASKFFLIFFSFIFLKAVVNWNRDKFRDSLLMLKNIIPYLMYLIAAYVIFKGRVSGSLGVYHFGDAHHGEFTSDLCATAAFLYYILFDKKENLLVKILCIGALIAVLFVVMKLASRNGVVSFALMTMFCMYLFLKNATSLRKFGFILFGVFVTMAVLYVFADSPTIQRFIYKTEDQGGGDRIDYWYSGIQAFFKEPVFGLGGDESSSLYAVATYSPGVPPHVMHNTFLEMAVEYGLVGFTFYLILFLTVMWCGYKTFLYAVRTRVYILALPIISYTLVMFSGLFISRVWQLIVWYNQTFVFATYILYVYPIELAKRNPFLLSKRLSKSKSLAQMA